MGLPHNARPDSVFASKSGYYTNSGLDMGQYEETRDLDVALTNEEGEIFGWFEFSSRGAGGSPDTGGKNFGATETANVYAMQVWASDLFRRFNIDEPNGWAGPSGGHGNFKLADLVAKVRNNTIGDFNDMRKSLSWAEQVVLASFGYKSSYAGIRDYRKAEAVRQSGITESEYEAGRQSLKQKGAMSGNNALTPLGKELRGGELRLELWKLKRISSIKLARNLVSVAGYIKDDKMRNEAVQAARDLMLSDPRAELTADDAMLFCSSCADKMRKSGETIKASEIISAMKEAGMTTRESDFVVCRVPSGQIFHQTDFNLVGFSFEVGDMANKLGGELISNPLTGNFLVITWSVDAGNGEELIRQIKRLPQFQLLKHYGAFLSIL